MIWSRLALAAAATLVALALGEIALRLFVPRPPMVVWRQFAGIAERVNAVPAGELFASDPELFWRLRPGLERPHASGPLFGILSNAQGLREDHEIPTPKEEGEVRVLFLGDSCTFGEYLSHTESFVQGVEDSLRSGFPGAAVECINAGVPGYTLFQGWRFLETEGYGYEPDAVVVYFGWNEGASWGGMSDPRQYEALRSQLPLGPLRWSRVCRVLWQAVRSPAPSGGNGPASRVRRPRLRPDEFGDLLARVRESTRRRGVELLVLVGPHRNNLTGIRGRRSPYQVEAGDYCRSIRFGPGGADGCIDTVPAIQAMAATHPVPALFHDPVHPTGLVNRRIAGLVAAKLEPWMRSRLEGN